MKIIDTHCHLNDEALYKDLDSVISRARQAGVEKMVVIGCIFAVVLLVWGYVYYKRLMKACDSILERLENVPRNS